MASNIALSNMPWGFEKRGDPKGVGMKVNVLPLRQEPKDKEAPITLPTVIGVEEEEYRKPLENAPAAMEPAHVR